MQSLTFASYVGLKALILRVLTPCVAEGEYPIKVNSLFLSYDKLSFELFIFFLIVVEKLLSIRAASFVIYFLLLLFVFKFC